MSKPNNVFKEPPFSTRELVPFGPKRSGLFVYRAERTQEYVKQLYGPDCLQVAKRTHYHKRILGFTLPIPFFTQQTYIPEENNHSCAIGHTPPWNS